MNQIDKIEITVKTVNNPEEETQTVPVVVITLFTPDPKEYSFPAGVFNSPSGYGHAIDIALMQYQIQNTPKDETTNEEANNSGDNSNAEQEG